MNARARRGKAARRQQAVRKSPSFPEQCQGVACHLLLLALLLATAWAYTPVIEADFVNFDDDDYVYANPAVRAGLDVQGLRWAFTSAHASNYHPLAWISHMLDVELFGMKPGAHHTVNLLLHLGNVMLLYVFVKAATRRGWAALAVAALWALHPLHVEASPGFQNARTC